VRGNAPSFLFFSYFCKAEYVYLKKQETMPSQKLSLQQKLLQKLSPQQIQVIKLLEIPTVQLEQRIKKEL